MKTMGSDQRFCLFLFPVLKSTRQEEISFRDILEMGLIDFQAFLKTDFRLAPPRDESSLCEAHMLSPPRAFCPLPLTILTSPPKGGQGLKQWG
jgi:hypothetical protein